MKTGYRSGDTAEMVILEFLPSEEEATGSRNSRKKS